MFEKEFIQKQKDLLEQERKDLELELGSFAKKEKESEDDWDTKYPEFEEGSNNPEEEVNEVEEYENLLPAEYALELRLKNVNEALERIERGTYGICESCKKEVSKERLEANPSAKKCLECNEL